MNNYEVFLGGHDAEMATIKDLAEAKKLPTHDANLGWGASADSYTAEIENALEQGKMPVLVELDTSSLSDEVRQRILDIDHHGDRSDEDAALVQFAELIGVELTREQQLIALNDTGYIKAMEDYGASLEEIAKVRALDRKEQGITQEQEDQAEEALNQMERYPELGDLIIVRMPHSKTATVTDRLYGSQEKEHILILSEDGEVNYYGDGLLCKTLNEKFEGWCGGKGLGEKGDNAFWGGYPNQEEVETFIKNYLEQA